MRIERWRLLGTLNPCLGGGLAVRHCVHVPREPLPSWTGAVRWKRESCPFWLQEFLAQKGDRWEAILPQRPLGDIV